jgi:hypothetical protein
MNDLLRRLLSHNSRPVFRTVRTACTIAFVSVSLAACGSSATDSAHLSPGTVAEVGHAQITKTTLDQWMHAMFGGDFYEETHQVALTSLLAPPPEHTSCVSELDGMAAIPGDHKLSSPQIDKLCAELYEAIKEQALTYLIRSEADLQEAAERGVDVTNSQVEDEFSGMRARQFPSEAELQTYLAQRHLTLPIVHFVLKQDLVGRDLEPKLYAAFGKGGGGGKGLEERADANERSWVDQTICAPGYVVARCRQYPYFKPGVVEQPYTTASPAHLIFEIERLEPVAVQGAAHPKLAEDLECHNTPTRLACKGVSKKQSEEVQRRTALRLRHQ